MQMSIALLLQPILKIKYSNNTTAMENTTHYDPRFYYIKLNSLNILEMLKETKDAK
jgi:hypothetical protein